MLTGSAPMTRVIAVPVAAARVPQTVRLSESGFCVAIEGQNKDVFFLLEVDLETEEVS